MGRDDMKCPLDIALLTTGGTIEKTYDPVQGVFSNDVSVLDAMLAEDPMSRVACETLVTTGLVVVAGEVTTEAYVDIPRTVRDTIKGIGYDRGSLGFDGGACGVMVTLDEQ